LDFTKTKISHQFPSLLFLGVKHQKEKEAEKALVLGISERSQKAEKGVCSVFSPCFSFMAVS
jgi:hypothetical protein